MVTNGIRTHVRHFADILGDDLTVITLFSFYFVTYLCYICTFWFCIRSIIRFQDMQAKLA